jgi:uncharacterized protein (UPF0548 family)
VLRARRPSDDELIAIADRLADARPTFDAGVGAGRGFHHDEWGGVLRSQTTWAEARAALDQWAAHGSAGVRVQPHRPPRLGLTVALGIRLGPGWVVAPCRVTAMVDSPEEFGFTYATLPGHPEQGEESFTLRRGERITFTVAATSRPADVLTRLGGPVARVVQQRTSRRYLQLGGLGCVP